MPVFSQEHKEKIHWVLYDRNPGTLKDLQGEDEDDSGFGRLLGSGNVLQFFNDIQKKTRLETNMDTAGMLTRNTFEVRALRVIIAPLDLGEAEEENGNGNGNGNGGGAGAPVDDEEEDDEVGVSARVVEQFIYNSVTTFKVGEKVYLQAPTFYFPSGTGTTFGRGASANLGEPTPMSTFRLAEAVLIANQQPFNVEIAFTRGIDRLEALKRANISIWVALEGYLIREVQ